MKKYIFLFYFSFILQINAQTNKVIDSLLIEIKKTNNDTLIVNHYFAIASEFVNIDVNKSTYYSKLILSKSNKVNYKKGVAQYYYVKAKEFYLLGDLKKSLQCISKGKKFLTNKNSELYIDFCYLEGLNLSALSEFDKGIKVTKHTLNSLNPGSKKYLQIARLNFALASLYIRNNQFDESLKFLPIAINNFRKVKNSFGEIQCYVELYNVYYLLGDDKNAFNAILEALNVYKENNLNNLLALRTIYYKLGGSYSRKDNFNKAIKYFKLALSLNVELTDDIEKYTISGMLAEAYCYSNQYKKCLQTIDFANKNLYYDETNLQYSYLLKSKAYFGLKEYNLSKRCIDSAIVKVPILKAKGIIDFNEKQYFKDLSLIEYELGNYKEAYLNTNKYSEIEIEDLKSEKAKRIETLQEQFESKEKDLKLKNLLFYNQKKELESLKSKKRIAILSIVIFLLSVGVILFCIFYRIKIKNNHLLQTKNYEIERKNSDLISAREIMKKLLHEKEVLLREIHHRVKNNLQLVVSLLNIQSRVNRHPTVNEFIEKSQSRIISMSLIHQNLYNTEDVSQIYFQKYLEDLVDNILHTFNNKLIKVSISSNGYYFDIQTAIPMGLIINEILCNSLKHAFGEGVHGEIIINLQKIDDTFILTLSDDGKGMDDKKKRKDAIGMDLVELLIIQLRATIDKVEGKGTKYEIKFKELIKTQV